ncbi:MAG TPA: PA14 domain-containing protein, partial [Planctomycetota bacterium]|nr:PA14 domain-containing protein [Planctomycetota bacterium]
MLRFARWPSRPHPLGFCLLLVLSVVGSTGISAGERAHNPNPRVPNETQPRPGLIAWYYEGREFDDKKLIFERIEPNINFEWGNDEPAPGVPEDGFCVRFVGSLHVKDEGHYTLTTASDDGVRLSIDGKQVIDHWVDQAETRVSVELDLTSGQHEIQLDYYENNGGASCKLYWMKKDGKESLIPPNVFKCDPKIMKHPAQKAAGPDLTEQHPEFPEGFNLADWTEEKSNDPKGQEHMSLGWQKSARKEDRATVGPRYTLKSPYTRYHILRRPAAADGTNDAPLITTLGLQQTDQGAAASFRLAYCWDARNFVAIGMSGRYNTAVWVVQQGRRTFDNGFTNYITDTYYRPAYFRLVLLSDSILVQASAQRYFNYRTLYVIHNRKDGMTGKPTTVMGIGTIPWDKDYGKANLCNDWPSADMSEEFTEILYFDQRAGMNVHPGRLPEITEATDWFESENQLNLKAQPQLWNMALLGKDYKSFLAPQAIEQVPQVTKDACDKLALDFMPVDLKENSEPYNFALNPLFKTKDLRKTSALVETTIPRGEDPFVRILFGVMQQGSIKVGGNTISSMLVPGYYENNADRFAVIGRVDPANSGVLRFKL